MRVDPAKRRSTVGDVSEPIRSTYTVILTKAEDGWFCGQVAEVPEAISQGRSTEEAKENVSEALAAAIEWRLADGERVSGTRDGRIEDLEIALYVEERLQGSSGERRPFDEVVRDIGFQRVLEDEH